MKKRRRLKKKFKILLILILFLLIAIILGRIIIKSTPSKVITNKVITTTTKPSNKASLVMVGDCLIHSFVYTAAKVSDNSYSFSSMFTQIEDLIDNHDLAYYNQESIIGGKALGLSNYPRFNSPEEIGDDMVNLGFNLVSLANNHTLDKGEQGVINSVTYWKTKENVYASGQALSNEERDNIKIKEVNGIKYAMLSYTTVTNGILPASGKEYLTNIYSPEKAKQDIDSIKDKVDLIIVAMHWGEEYMTSENQSQRTIANYLSSLGVNLIIGTHPHVIEPVEMINNTLVFYSLGNFISAQDTADKLTGALASLNIKKEADNSITFSNIKVNLIYTSFKYTKPYNFKIYPYTDINNSILNNYVSYYNKYKQILTKYDSNVGVVPIND